MILVPIVAAGGRERSQWKQRLLILIANFDIAVGKENDAAYVEMRNMSRNEYFITLPGFRQSLMVTTKL